VRWKLLQHLNRLSSYGVGFRSFTEPYLDSCGIFKDAVIAILGTIAKQERVRISERVRAGLDRAKSQGTKSGKPIGRPRGQCTRATEPANYELKVGLSARSPVRLVSARRPCAGLVKVRARPHRYAKTFRKGLDRCFAAIPRCVIAKIQIVLKSCSVNLMKSKSALLRRNLMLLKILPPGMLQKSSKLGLRWIGEQTIAIGRLSAVCRSGPKSS